MSGGYFDHNQYRIAQIADDIEHLIGSNDDETLDDWGTPRGRGYSEATIAKFKEAVRTLRRAEAMAQRVDWMVSDDDSEDTFHKRWDKEVQNA